jgi:hypothetical protein
MERDGNFGQHHPDQILNSLNAVLHTLGSGGVRAAAVEPPFPGERRKAPIPFPGGNEVPETSDSDIKSHEYYAQYATGSAAHEASEGTDPVRPDTIFVDIGWGQANEPTPLDDVSPSTREQMEERYVRGKVDKEIREELERRGIEIHEQHRPPRDLGRNEAVVSGRIDTARLERAMPRIAPEVQVIPTERFDSFAARPHEPTLAYIEGLSGGDGKYALDTPEQTEKIKQLFENEPWAKDQFARILTFKPIIETPSDRYTSYRVLTTATGDIVASGLLYSPEREEGQTPTDTTAVIPDYYSPFMMNFLDDPRSPYCLNARDVTSNVHGGGGCIPLDPTDQSRPITPKEQEILDAHGIEGQQAPGAVRAAAQKIGQHLGGESALVYGIDFMQDTEGNIWFLEVNTGPGVQVMNEVANGGKKDVEQGYRLLMGKTIDSVFPPAA